VEHAAEFERRNVLLEFLDVRGDPHEGRIVCFRARQAEQLGGVGQSAADAQQRADRALERFLLLAELLRALLVAPDFRIAQQVLDFGQSSLLAFEVKDTSAAPPTVLAGR
jgi:hypothetical protein